jgi:hypothetical protein
LTLFGSGTLPIIDAQLNQAFHASTMPRLKHFDLPFFDTSQFPKPLFLPFETHFWGTRMVIPMQVRWSVYISVAVMFGQIAAEKAFVL